jgi:hypothetical protein
VYEFRYPFRRRARLSNFNELLKEFDNDCRVAYWPFLHAFLLAEFIVGALSGMAFVPPFFSLSSPLYQGTR